MKHAKIELLFEKSNGDQKVVIVKDMTLEDATIFGSNIADMNHWEMLAVTELEP